MTTHPVHLAPPWRGWLRRHERTLSVLYLGLVALACLAMAAGPTRRFVLGRLQGLSDRYDRQWDNRLAEGRRLVTAGTYVQAIAYLERLDRVFPAPSPRHARDKQREELLRLLARSYEGAGHKHKAIAVYDRLIAYDPLDYVNVALKAAASRRLLSGWAIAAEADAAWDSTLKIFPNHLPSVRGRIDYHQDKGEWIPVTTVYRAYLDAFLLQHVNFRFGGASQDLPLLVDGRAHAVLVDLPEGADTLEIRDGGFPIAVDSMSVSAAAAVGLAAPSALVRIPSSAVAARNMVAAAHGAWLPRGDSSFLRIALPRAAGGGQLRLVVRLFKPVEEDTWDLVTHAYAQLLDSTNLKADETRTVPFATAQDADAVYAHLGWAAPQGFDLGAKP